MIEFRYLLSGVGYISKETVKKIIRTPGVKFSGFKRYHDGLPGACGIVVFSGKTHRLDIQYFKKINLAKKELQKAKQTIKV